jgi:radical SAM superfamily enzyme YgiQ (UPF0313 family)
MIGLPYETDEDVRDIYNLMNMVLSRTKQISRRVNITVSVSNFVPKAHTPFQWVSQNTVEEFRRKHKILKDLFYNKRGVYLKLHDENNSFLEGIVARGDEKIGELVELAFKKGAKFDGWRDYFNLNIWKNAMEELEINPLDYTGERDTESQLPWDFIETGISREFYLRELKKAEEASLTKDCRDGCENCGINKIIEKCR